MKELVFMRHGTPLSIQESGSAGDAGRKLAPDGKTQIELSARRLKQLGFSPGVIISSPYVRAVQTADIASGFFPAAKRVSEPVLATPLSLTAILDAIDSDAGGAASVLVIGHQPTLSSLSGRLLGTASPYFTTGSFAYLKLSGGIGSEKADLAEFFAPERF